MIVATHQPIFCPWSGFFYKMFLSDLFVLLDDVQFPLGTTWVSRNRFKSQQGVLWLNVPVWKKGKGLQLINQVKMCYETKWKEKHLRSMEMAYKNAPYFSDHFPFWQDLYNQQSSELFSLNFQFIEYLKTCFQISTPIQKSSSLTIDLTGNERLIELCKRVNASVYLAQYEARKYIREDLFSAAGIKVEYFRFSHPVYPQLGGNFSYNLSSWDLVFNCGPAIKKILLRHYSKK